MFVREIRNWKVLVIYIIVANFLLLSCSSPKKENCHLKEYDFHTKLFPEHQPFVREACFENIGETQNRIFLRPLNESPVDSIIIPKNNSHDSVICLIARRTPGFRLIKYISCHNNKMRRISIEIEYFTKEYLMVLEWFDLNEESYRIATGTIDSGSRDEIYGDIFSEEFKERTNQLKPSKYYKVKGLKRYNWLSSHVYEGWGKSPLR